MNENLEHVDSFIEDAKILMDIHTISDSYWANRDTLKVWHVDREFIDFSFRYGMMTFSDWEIDVIKKTLRKMGYEYIGFIVSRVEKGNSIYLSVRMRVPSKQRKVKDFLRYIYRAPIRLYHRYRFWRNYGTWRYW